MVEMRIGETHSTPYPHLFGSIALSLMIHLCLKSLMASHGTKSNFLSWSQSPSLIGPCLPHRPCFVHLPLAHSFLVTSVICVCLFAFQTRLTCFHLRLFRLSPLQRSIPWPYNLRYLSHSTLYPILVLWRIAIWLCPSVWVLLIYHLA